LVLVAAFAAAAFADFAAVSFGASFGESLGESFGESANAVPVSRNSDSASDAIFLIASLFFFAADFEHEYGKCVPPRLGRYVGTLTAISIQYE
jgi:hypothetical protein